MLTVRGVVLLAVVLLAGFAHGATIADAGQSEAFFTAPTGPEPNVLPDVSASSLAAARGALQQYAHHGLKFGLFLPSSWQPGDGKHPIIVFLHGRGESGGFAVTNAQSLPWLLVSGHNASFTASFPFIVITPQCPQECAMENGWQKEVLRATAELVQNWIVPELGGDPHRTYLTGQSMGGHGAWMFAAQQPRLFAAVVVVCGYTQGSEQAAEVARRLVKGGGAVGIYHAEDDSVIPVGASDQVATALNEAAASGGGEPLTLRYVRYKHAPGPPISEFAQLLGHGSYELAYRDVGLYEWLLNQRCGRCGRPLPHWHALPQPSLSFG